MKNILIIAAALLLFSSCQKVIKVDLNTANPQFVIEANLYEGTHDFKVHITKTTSYFTTDSAPAVNGAVVTLSANGNPPQIMVPTGNGWYELYNYTGTANTSYQLTVNAEGKSFEATSYLPVSPVFDSLTYEEFGGGFGGGNFDPYLMKAHFKDSIGVGNYYRIIVTKNDSIQNQPFDLYLIDDKLRDGEYFHAPIFSAFCDIDDTMDVELLSMDKHVFDYFATLGDILTGDANNSAAPANPNTNWSNSALGYFGAFSTQKKSIRIK
ncbi:hypothetical protein EMGBS15_08220 [Filimonas sp.]|nr:hypothetical protein EMGBS15_08220 [Filimonas sp.]